MRRTFYAPTPLGGSADRDRIVTSFLQRNLAATDSKAIPRMSPGCAVP